MATLAIDLLGKRLRNPVFNASGTLGYGREIEPLWPIDTLGAYVTKGLSLKPHHGNPPPRIWEEGTGILNSIGLQNIGLERFFDECFPFFKKRKTPIIVNFFGFTDEEYIRCAEAIRPDPLIVALEINLSCPNVKKGGICMGKEAQGVFSIIKAVKAVTKIPLIAKLTPEVTDIVQIASAAVEAGVDGLTLLNTMPGAAIEVKSRRLAFRGGFSGPALKPIALKAVTDVSRAVSVPVIGSGGIMSCVDALEYLMAGARAVQVGTATFVDPYAIPAIIEGLKAYLTTHRLPRTEALVGLARG